MPRCYILYGKEIHKRRLTESMKGTDTTSCFVSEEHHGLYRSKEDPEPTEVSLANRDSFGIRKRKSLDKSGCANKCRSLFQRNDLLLNQRFNHTIHTDSILSLTMNNFS